MRDVESNRRGRRRCNIDQPQTWLPEIARKCKSRAREVQLFSRRPQSSQQSFYGTQEKTPRQDSGSQNIYGWRTYDLSPPKKSISHASHFFCAMDFVKFGGIQKDPGDPSPLRSGAAGTEGSRNCSWQRRKGGSQRLCPWTCFASRLEKMNYTLLKTPTANHSPKGGEERSTSQVAN